MRLYNFLFVLVLVLVIVFAFANLDSLRTTTQVVIPFFGKQILPMRLYGCVALILLAAVYSILWYFSSTRLKAKSADYLTKLEETRRILDEKEANRFAQLQAQLESATQDILARVGGVAAPQKSGGFFSRLTQKESPAPLPSNLGGVEGLVQRIEKVRDELAADIASSEHAILEAIEVLKDRKSG